MLITLVLQIKSSRKFHHIGSIVMAITCHNLKSIDRILNVNVNVSVYSLKSPLSSADFTIYAPGIGTLSYTVSSPLGRIQHLRTLLQL